MSIKTDVAVNKEVPKKTMMQCKYEQYADI